MLCYMNVKFLTWPTGYLKIFQVVRRISDAKKEEEEGRNEAEKEHLLPHFSLISFKIVSVTCLALLRHYLLSFGGSITDSGYHDRDIFGKAAVAGMIIVTLPTLVANVFSEGHSLLTVRIEVANV